VYPLLARLCRLQLLAATPQPSSTGPPRKYYSLTAAGVAALRHGARQWHDLSTAVDALLGESVQPESRSKGATS